MDAVDQDKGPVTPARPSRRVAMVNALLERSWRRQWSARPTLDPAALIARARAQTGLSDFGDDNGWRARLDVLSAAASDEAQLSPLGLTAAHGQMTGALANRLRAVALWARHPEILNQPIPAPIIVLGQMRSGTTRVQRLLACDDRLAHTRFFESWNPVPRGRIDDRRLRAWAGLTIGQFINPEFRAIHPSAAGQADEEAGLHGVSLYGSVFEAQWRVPSFAAYCETIDPQPVYAEFKRLLQTVAWLRRDSVSRPWIMKLPQFTQDLDAVLTTFPDARLVCLHRDTATLVGSSASLVFNQMRMQSDHVDPHWIGREWLRKVTLRQDRTAQARARADVGQIDIGFDAMNADWRGQMQAIYAMLDLPLTDAVAARMAAFLHRSRRLKLDRHRYGLADFGLRRDEIQPAAATA